MNYTQLSTNKNYMLIFLFFLKAKLIVEEMKQKS